MKKFIIALLASVMLLTGCGTTGTVYMDEFFDWTNEVLNG